MMSNESAKIILSRSMNFTPELLKELKVAYRQAVRDGQEAFLFNGHVLLTDYAKYMVEYLESMFKTGRHRG